MALVEAGTNVIVGYVFAVVTQIIVFPLVGLKVSLGDNLLIGAAFTLASVVRSHLLRRLFERLRLRGLKREAAALWRAAAWAGVWAGQLPMR
jgi:hypothetical protein